MGEMADDHTDDNLYGLTLHRSGRCGELGGPCPHCEEDEAMAEVVTEDGEVLSALVPAAPPTRALISREALAEEADQRKLLGEYVRGQMVQGTDYGVIPGTNKPTLLKPGAEKLVELFRCTAEYDLTTRVEDWDKPLFHYAFTCRVRHRASGAVVAEGVGSCNSMEARYRWRAAERVCPHCKKPAIIKGRAEYGGGWLCFKKKDGCGAKFRDGDPAVEGQAAGKVENDDVYTLTNTILKIAKKRALVDASITLARCSDIFTQDVEDARPTGPEPDEDEGRAAPPADKLTPAQVREVNEKLTALAALGMENARGKFLRWLGGDGLTRVEDIWAEDYAKCVYEIDRLTRRRQGTA